MLRKSIIIYPRYANINLEALRLTGLRHDEYMFCVVIEQYQVLTGWVECGEGNVMESIYALKSYIGTKVGLEQRKMNRKFKKLRVLGFIEETDDKKKFRLTSKYFVLQHAAPKSEAELQRKLDAHYVQQEAEKSQKLPFVLSAYGQDFEAFKRDMLSFKNLPSNTDWGYYYDQIKHYYAVEHEQKAYIDWRQRCKDWIDKNRREGTLQTIKNEAEPPPKALPRRSNADIAKDYDLFYGKLFEPETDNLEEFRETVQTWGEIAKLALSRGNKILNDKEKEITNKLLTMLTDSDRLKRFFEHQQAKKKGTTDVSDKIDIQSLTDKLSDKK